MVAPPRKAVATEAGRRNDTMTNRFCQRVAIGLKAGRDIERYDLASKAMGSTNFYEDW